MLWYNLIFNNHPHYGYGYGYGYSPVYGYAPALPSVTETTTTTTSTDSGDANNSSTEESKDGTEAEKQTASTSSTTVTKTVTKQGSQLSIWELLLYGVLYFCGMVAVFWILAWILKKVLDV